MDTMALAVTTSLAVLEVPAIVVGLMVAGRHYFARYAVVAWPTAARVTRPGTYA